MKIKILSLIALILFNVAPSPAQNITKVGQNIKTLMDKLYFEEVPFLRDKSRSHRTWLDGETDPAIRFANIKKFQGQHVLYEKNLLGLPYFGYADFNRTEILKRFNICYPSDIYYPTDIHYPTDYRAVMKFHSAKSQYYFIPFTISYTCLYCEDIVVVCNKDTGIVSDILFTGHMGIDQATKKYSCIMQWQLNTNYDLVVSELKLASIGNVYFEKVPEIVFMKRSDTTYRIDDNGKFYVVSTKEYKSKNYTKYELSQNGKNICDGNEIIINSCELNIGI